VALLGTVNQDIAREQAASEIDAYLGKPVRQAELHASLISLLRAETAKGTSTSPEVPTARGGLQGHILVADDNAVNREMAQGMVELLGCTVQTVPDGQAAVLTYRSQKFDAILMDCQMPGMDGYEATRQIRCHEAARQTDERIPIIALTANVFQGQRQKCLDADMDDFLAKPFALEHLRGTLLSWLPTGSDASAEGRAGDSRHDIPVDHADTAEIGETRRTAQSVQLDPKAITNLRALQKDGAESVILKFSRVFEQTSDELLVRLQLGMEQLDAGEVNAAAHSLKTSAANLGAGDLAALARKLEELARDDDLVAAGPVFAQLKDAYLAARAALDALCQREQVAS
jgi:CheY-like chemotaxis protein